MLLTNTSHILGDWKERMIPGYSALQGAINMIQDKPVTCGAAMIGALCFQSMFLIFKDNLVELLSGGCGPTEVPITRRCLD